MITTDTNGEKPPTVASLNEISDLWRLYGKNSRWEKGVRIGSPSWTHIELCASRRAPRSGPCLNLSESFQLGFDGGVLVARKLSVGVDRAHTVGAAYWE